MLPGLAFLQKHGDGDYDYSLQAQKLALHPKTPESSHLKPLQNDPLTP